METVGVDLGSDFRVQTGTVTCILGNNLGSHGTGYFVESFSCLADFCRICMATMTCHMVNIWPNASTAGLQNNMIRQLAV